MGLRARCRSTTRRFPGTNSRSAALRTVDGCQIGGELAGRGRIARIVLLQILEQLGTATAFAKTVWAAMACRATIRKQLRRRFALIEILGMCRSAGERIEGAEGKQTMPQCWLRLERR